MSNADLVVVHAFASRPEADVAVSALEAAGIDATIQADTGGGMRGHLAWSGVGFSGELSSGADGSAFAPG